ncbi:DUF378 domain-containing protein [Sporosarcina sp. P13]|nr:DUF378 domain-containing protein [Sporosarcina sp. P13]PIC63960.1 DUF378 domain-containing protein [Sporosarcina sp. P13]
MSGFMRFALALVIIGALNWGLIGFFNFDIVATAFGGQNTILAKIVYAVVGLSGLATIALLFKTNEEIVTDVEREEEPNDRFDRIRNVNYNTEFGEELDFKKKRKEVKEPTKEDEL